MNIHHSRGKAKHHAKAKAFLRRSGYADGGDVDSDSTTDVIRKAYSHPFSYDPFATSSKGAPPVKAVGEPQSSSKSSEDDDDHELQQEMWNHYWATHPGMASPGHPDRPERKSGGRVKGRKRS